MLPISRFTRVCVQVLSLAVALALSVGIADAKRIKRAHPLHPIVTMQAPAAAQFPAAGGSWHAVTPVPAGAFQGGAGAILQLTDGRVLVHENCTANWWALTPNGKGSYIGGSWKQVASLPAGYAPLYFSSAVLPDGRVIINGGEYNDSGSGCNAVWTNLGAIYDPVRNKWTSVAAPSGWNSIGDSQNVVMPDGSYVLANCCALFGSAATNEDMAKLDAKTLTWTSVPHTGKVDANDEEGWTLMPDGSLLTVDASGLNSTTSHAERYYNGAWHDAGNLTKLNGDIILCNEQQPGFEMGPQVLLPTGKVLAVGATQHTAIYTPGATLTDTGSWAAGPDFPTIAPSTHPDGEADGPAALMPSGNVLLMASPCEFQTPAHFYEFNGSSLTRVSEPPNAPNDSSFVGRLMTLPTGEVLLTDYTSDIEIYRPRGRPKTAWAPVITSFSSNMTQGQRYLIAGKRFNGLSQASGYGDDSQSATNFPLVRITNSSGKVTYARTFNFSSMGVAVAGRTKAVVQIPAHTPTGPGMMEVVANGIASAPVAVTIVAPTPTAVADED